MEIPNTRIDKLVPDIGLVCFHFQRHRCIIVESGTPSIDKLVAQPMRKECELKRELSIPISLNAFERTETNW